MIISLRDNYRCHGETHKRYMCSIDVMVKLMKASVKKDCNPCHYIEQHAQRHYWRVQALPTA